MEKIFIRDNNTEEVEVTSDSRRDKQVTIKFNIDKRNGSSQAITFMNHDNLIDFVRQMNIGLGILLERDKYYNK